MISLLSLRMCKFKGELGRQQWWCTPASDGNVDTAPHAARTGCWRRQTEFADPLFRVCGGVVLGLHVQPWESVMLYLVVLDALQLHGTLCRDCTSNAQEDLFKKRTLRALKWVSDEPLTTPWITTVSGRAREGEHFSPGPLLDRSGKSLDVHIHVRTLNSKLAFSSREGGMTKNASFKPESIRTMFIG